MRVLYFLSCVFAGGGRKYWSSSTCVGGIERVPRHRRDASSPRRWCRASPRHRHDASSRARATAALSAGRVVTHTRDSVRRRGTPPRGPCARTGSGRPHKRGTPRRRSGRASSCIQGATSAPAAASIPTRHARRSSGPGRRGTYRRRCRCASCTCVRRFTLGNVDATDAGPLLPLLLEGLRLGVAGPRVGLGEREGREVRRQRRERVRVLLVGRLKRSRVGGARIRP